MKVDKDTAEIVTKAKDIEEMVGTRGWQIFQAQLEEKILNLQMICNVTGNTPEERVLSMEVNQATATSLFELLQDTLSTPEQVKSNVDGLNLNNESIYQNN